MDSIKVLAMVEEAKVHDLKRRELIKYVLKLRKFVVKQNEKIIYQKSKISHLKEKLKELSLVEPAQKSDKSPEKPAEGDPEESSPERKEQEKFLDDIKSAAEAQSLKNGFIYEPTSGLYYDTSTGYYYNAEYGLYYDGSTGKYYSYDQATKEFTYHSTAVTAEPPENEQSSVDRPKNAAGKKRKVRKKEQPNEPKSTEDLEDGEISSEDSYVECSSDDEHIYEDISKHYPPSLRVIVQQSAMEKLKVGTLFLVTCKGGSLGREGEHDVVIPDINVSKCHLKFTYDDAEAVYKCQDQGSRNGTLLNGTRMSESTQESDLLSIPHGSVIQISETKLLCHVHPGAATCGYCEPGLLMQAADKSNAGDSSSSSGPSHKSQLKMLQRKYGLEKEKYTDTKKDLGYNDRAEHRRETVGSSNPNEKTATASVNESIPATNKGFKMLSKLGWKAGQGLGKASDAIVEPILVQGNSGTMGLGNSSNSGVTPGAVTLNVDGRKNEMKTLIWKKTQQRYTESKQKAVNIFGESDDEDGGGENGGE